MDTALLHSGQGGYYMDVKILNECVKGKAHCPSSVPITIVNLKYAEQVESSSPPLPVDQIQRLPR